MDQKRSPPPLPPRPGISRPLNQDVPSADIPRLSESISSFSIQSLIPGHDELSADKRTLLLIYIHGFMGNETSFQGFPGHVHNLVSTTLADTHRVYSKIYPRYRSRRPIEHARDGVSQWLESIETPNTDVILLGHSMGGLLSAEVVLQRARLSSYGHVFRHRILGTINFDTPFLGMHPGVIWSGLGSLFRSDSGTSTPSPGDSAPPEDYFRQDDIGSLHGTGANAASVESIPLSSESGSHSVTSSRSPFLSPPADPNFNPPLPIDVKLPARSSLDNALHFVTKHSNDLTGASKRYVMSHLEFGGCLADYAGLQSRYQGIRNLEKTPSSTSVMRVRFVNYYTASTGRFKHEKESPPKQLPEKENEPTNIETEAMSVPSQVPPTEETSVVAVAQSLEDIAINDQQPDLGIFPPENISGETNKDKAFAEDSAEDSEPEEPLTVLEPLPVEDELEEMDNDTQTPSLEEADMSTQKESSQSALDDLLPLPPKPQEPPAFDASIYSDNDTRKLAEKEHSRVLKAYQRALKDREKAVKEREKLVKKREKKARQELEKQLKLEKKQSDILEKEERKRLAAAAATTPRDSNSSLPRQETSLDPKGKKEKKKKDKKFCMLPAKINGQRDPTWVRVHMEGVDEVGAHCGLFFMNKNYEELVKDVSFRIEGWVQEDLSNKAAHQLEQP